MCVCSVWGVKVLEQLGGSAESSPTDGAEQVDRYPRSRRLRHGTAGPPFLVLSKARRPRGPDPAPRLIRPPDLIREKANANAQV